MVDYGNGPAAGYRLYYGLSGSPLTTYEDFTVSSGSISDLEIETSYDFAVSVLRSVDGETLPGKLSSIASGETQCLGMYTSVFAHLQCFHLIFLIC